MESQRMEENKKMAKLEGEIWRDVLAILVILSTPFFVIFNYNYMSEFNEFAKFIILISAVITCGAAISQLTDLYFLLHPIKSQAHRYFLKKVRNDHLILLQDKVFGKKPRQLEPGYNFINARRYKPIRHVSLIEFDAPNAILENHIRGGTTLDIKFRCHVRKIGEKGATHVAFTEHYVTEESGYKRYLIFKLIFKICRYVPFQSEEVMGEQSNVFKCNIALDNIRKDLERHSNNLKLDNTVKEYSIGRLHFDKSDPIHDHLQEFADVSGIHIDAEIDVSFQ